MAEKTVEKKVWLVTGAGRGMGVDIAQAALAAGHAVVATGRNPERVSSALGAHDDLLVVKLDVTSLEDAEKAVRAAVDRFGRIDVLVNNAGNFYAGFFEEISAEQFRAQVETNLFGPVNVARAVLPVMRAQRSGVVVAISSTAGISGQEFVSAYAASKFGVEGWIESLTPEVAPFGIRTMLVEPGFFRTDLLTPESTNYAVPSIDDYAERTKQTITAWNGMNGKQGGDPAKLATALVELASQDEPPLRWAAGADAVQTVEQKARNLLTQVDAHRDLSSSLAHDDASSNRQPLAAGRGDLVGDGGGQGHVEIGQPAGRVRGTAEGQAAPADVDVRVVVAVLGDRGHPVHHGDRDRKRGQLRGPHDRVTIALPAGQIIQGRRNGVVGKQFGHADHLAQW